MIILDKIDTTYVVELRKVRVEFLEYGYLVYRTELSVPTALAEIALHTGAGVAGVGSHANRVFWRSGEDMEFLTSWAFPFNLVDLTDTGV